MSESETQSQDSDNGTQRKVTVEYVCTANGGRSPMAETEAIDYVEELGLEDLIQVESSGSDGENAENFMTMDPAELISYIEAGVKGGAYKGKAMDRAKNIVENKDAYIARFAQGDKQARKDIELSIMYLNNDEVANRNKVLLEEGITPRGHYHKQTVARSGVDVILTMKQKNADQVARIYEGSGHSPVIATLCAYAGLPGDIPDPYGKDIDGFRECRNAITKAVRSSIDRIAKEYRLK